MYRDIKFNFTERNNQLVREVDSSVDRQLLEERFLQLSSDIQSVPAQSMFAELELGIVSNLMAFNWLRDEAEGAVETGLRSLIRLLQSSGCRISKWCLESQLEVEDYLVELLELLGLWNH